MPNSLENRMKAYEHITRNYLTRRIPVIIRIDGKAFHTFTKGIKRPFDDKLHEVMEVTTKLLLSNIQGCKLAYTQSDEISLLLTDYDAIETDAWFGYNIQKIASISASMATLYFNRTWENVCDEYAHEQIAQQMLVSDVRHCCSAVFTVSFMITHNSPIFNSNT